MPKRTLITSTIVLALALPGTYASAASPVHAQAHAPRAVLHAHGLSDLRQTSAVPTLSLGPGQEKRQVNSVWDVMRLGVRSWQVKHIWAQPSRYAGRVHNGKGASDANFRTLVLEAPGRPEVLRLPVAAELLEASRLAVGDTVNTKVLSGGEPGAQVLVFVHGDLPIGLIADDDAQVRIQAR